MNSPGTSGLLNSHSHSELVGASVFPPAHTHSVSQCVLLLHPLLSGSVHGLWMPLYEWLQGVRGCSQIPCGGSSGFSSGRLTFAGWFIHLVLPRAEHGTCTTLYTLTNAYRLRQREITCVQPVRVTFKSNIRKSLLAYDLKLSLNDQSEDVNRFKRGKYKVLF